VVGRLAVAPADHEIPGIAAAVLAIAPLEQIIELDRGLLVGDGEAQSVGLVGAAGTRTAGTRVNRFRAWIRSLQGGDLRSAAAASVGAPVRLQEVQGRLVPLRSTGLEMNASIPFETE